MKNIILTNGTLIDGTGYNALQKKDVIFDQNRIRKITDQPYEADQSSETTLALDLTGKFIVPGLIDTHVHFCSSDIPSPAEKYRRFYNSETHLAVEAEKKAKIALLNGVTCMRDLGAKDYISIKIRDLINNGFIPGPRIVACGYALAMTGGHGTPMISFEVDSPDEIRKAVRLMRKRGADCIKLMANGLSVNSPELNKTEMKAAVQTAHDADMKVAAHASVWKAVENAVNAGVDTIEHGYTLNKEIIEKMLKNGTILVPTFATVLQISKIGSEVEHWKDKMDAIHKRIETAMKSFQLAKEMGVQFAIGTDGSSYPLLQVGEIVKEMEAFQETGFSPEEILQAATLNAARAVGKEDEIGTIEAGKMADIVILNRNPLKDIGAYEDIFMVIKDGQIVVENGQLVNH